MKNQIIQLIEQADITQDDWEWDFLVLLPKTSYERGFFDAKMSEISESLSSSTEDYREELLKICDADIWKTV